MAKLLTGTRVYGTANVDNVLTVGNITPVNSTSNTTGSLIVVGGVGILGNTYTGNLVISGSAAAGNGITFADGTRQTTAAGGGGGIDQYARDTANLAIGIDATQNTRLNAVETINTNQNTSITIIQGVDLTQNTNITSVNQYAASAYALANSTVGVDATQNTNITAVNNYAVSAYGTANGANGLAVGAFALANTHTSQIAIIQGVDLGQNTTITAVNQFAQAAYNQANTASTSQIDQYARNTANLAIGIDATQNTQIQGIQGVDLAQNTAIAIIQGVDLTQNATITAVNQFAQAAYNKANTETLRILSQTTTATLAINGDNYDAAFVTALAGTMAVSAPTGSPTNGQKLLIRIKDNGTVRSISWTISSGGWRPVATVLPTVTIANKTLYIGAIYNTEETYWDVIAVAQQA